MAIHWNVAGEADSFINKWWGALLFPIFLTGIVALVVFLPKVDPRKENYEKFEKVYRIFLHVFVLFLFSMYVVTLAYNIGIPVQVDVVVPIGVGMLFIAIGNYMPKIKPNYFFGIRTPWTLENEEVWQKTHRVGGKSVCYHGHIHYAHDICNKCMALYFSYDHRIWWHDVFVYPVVFIFA